MDMEKKRTPINSEKTRHTRLTPGFVGRRWRHKYEDSTRQPDTPCTCTRFRVVAVACTATRISARARIVICTLGALLTPARGHAIRQGRVVQELPRFCERRGHIRDVLLCLRDPQCIVTNGPQRDVWAMSLSHWQMATSGLRA